MMAFKKNLISLAETVLHWLTTVLVTQAKAKLQTISSWLSPLNFIEKQTNFDREETRGNWSMVSRYR